MATEERNEEREAKKKRKKKSWKITLSTNTKPDQIQAKPRTERIREKKKIIKIIKKLHIIDHIGFASIDFDFELRST